MRFSCLRRLAIGLPASALVATLFLWAPQLAEASRPWQGVTITDQANVRSAPNTSAPRVDVLGVGQPVTVAGWVTGEEVEATNTTWAKLGEGRYIYSSLIRKNDPDGPPVPPADARSQGKWIDVNLTEQVLTAYVGSDPVRVTVISSGRPSYPSSPGIFKIQRRVFNETMDSGTTSVKDSYHLENVMFTQYFAADGSALHSAWWKSDASFGVPTSHGCVGLRYGDAQWLWTWASVGVPVYLHQ